MGEEDRDPLPNTIYGAIFCKNFQKIRRHILEPATVDP